MSVLCALDPAIIKKQKSQMFSLAEDVFTLLERDIQEKNAEGIR